MMRQPVVLLPGTLCDARLFAPLVERMADVAVFSVDDVTHSDSVQAVARDVLRNAPPRFALAGLSYGGIIAFEIMRQQPERVTHLALLNTTPYPPTDATRARLEMFAAMATRGEFRAITTEHLKDTLLHPAHRHDPILRRIVLEMAEAVGVDGFLNQVHAQLARPDSSGDLARIICPTLVLTGRQDEVCTVAIHEAMVAQLPNAQLVIVEECGHLSTLEQPEQVARAMRAWLAHEPARAFTKDGT
jgi:pimeloyl-ACP methyl ester carboxylesterase